MIMSPVVPSRGALRPLGLESVSITGGFWAALQETNAKATLEHVGERLEVEGWLGNFDLAAQGLLPAGRRGREFSDSEVYKYLEAMAWEIARSDDPTIEQTYVDVVARVGAAQEADGYISTAFGKAGQPARWSDLEWGHELYCLGHLMQAAVARLRTRPTAEDGLVTIACRAADLVCATFDSAGLGGVCGHPEVELGLVELGRATGRPEYIQQAQLFIERRGHGRLDDIQWGREYFLDDIPVREATVLRGHAVRANYLAAAAVDVAIETEDPDLRQSLARQWERTTARRTYLTGAQGSRRKDEAFGDDWELPPDGAYGETCAGIGSCMLAWRLLLADGNVRYADLIERTLYNVVATSPSQTGRSFFYSNTLQQRTTTRPDEAPTAWHEGTASGRQPWYDVSCCPPNVARTLASLEAYMATATAGGVQIHQYATMEIRTSLDCGVTVGLDVRTGYPHDGLVRIDVVTDSTGPWALTLRVPSWADGSRLSVIPIDGPGETREAAPGLVTITREFRVGDIIELSVPVQPRFTWPDPRIDGVRGCVAVERGPLVLAAESVDSVEIGLANLDTLQVDVGVHVSVVAVHAGERLWPYGTEPPSARDPSRLLPLVPYHSWAERGPSTMRVWLPIAQGNVL
jgi:uncharacterized protein